MAIILSQRQHDCYSFIFKYVDEHGISPTIHEIRIGLGLRALNPTCKLIDKLIDHHLIKRIPHKHRGLKINRRRKVARHAHS